MGLDAEWRSGEVWEGASRIVHRFTEWPTRANLQRPGSGPVWHPVSNLHLRPKNIQMNSTLSRIMDDYDRGTLTRRQLLTRLAALLTLTIGTSEGRSADAAGAGGTSTFEATGLDHIALGVSDVGRSRDFYVQHLGMKVSRDWSGSAFLTCGNNFVALFRASEPGLHHYCYSVRNYDVDAAEQKLRAAGLPNIHRTAGRIYFDDPDGLTVQLAASAHMPE
jgi:catechol 2,3-dioxygenase-like lactoylglutathione lyase family enzyme